MAYTSERHHQSEPSAASMCSEVFRRSVLASAAVKQMISVSERDDLELMLDTHTCSQQALDWMNRTHFLKNPVRSASYFHSLFHMLLYLSIVRESVYLLYFGVNYYLLSTTV